MWVLGTERRSTANAVSVLNLLATSPSPLASFTCNIYLQKDLTQGRMSGCFLSLHWELRTGLALLLVRDLCLWGPGVLLSSWQKGGRDSGQLFWGPSQLWVLLRTLKPSRGKGYHTDPHVYACDTYRVSSMSISCFLPGSMGYKCYLSTRNQTLSSLRAAEDKDTPTAAVFHLLCSVGKHLTNFTTVFFWAGFPLYNNPVMYGIQVGLATPTLLFLISSAWPWHRSAKRKQPSQTPSI